MSLLQNSNAISTGGAYNLESSLRFRSSASAYLTRTFSSAGNRKTWTWSSWIKRGKFDSLSHNLFRSNQASSAGIRFGGTSAGDTSNDTLRIFFANAGSGDLQTTQVFRDPSAWYHIVLTVDTTQATASNRVKLYINGVQVTSFTTATYPSQNYDTEVNNNIEHIIGSYLSGGSPIESFDGYQTEINFVDGQALTPSDFGEYDEDTGGWKPKRYTGTYGTNGFYLDMSTSSSTVLDQSSNSNDWTANNMNLTTSSATTYDIMNDVPTLTDEDTANFATLNPLVVSKVSPITYSNGNQDVSFGSSLTGWTESTIGVSSGKWYAEIKVTSASGVDRIIGIATPNTNNQSGYTADSYGYYGNGQKINNNSLSAYGASYTTGDVIGIALDLDAGTLVYYKNGVSQGTAFTGISGTYLISVSDSSNAGTCSYNANFGQRPFAYTPPTGYKKLNTYNLPDSTIVDGSQYFDIQTWTGDTTNPRSFSDTAFSPDLVWWKARNNAYSHNLFDSVRGATKVLYSNATAAEYVNDTSGTLKSFDTNGFTVGGDSNVNTVNQSGGTYVAWQWRASDSSSVSNTDGTITSTVSANTDSGFSVVTYTGNSTDNTNYTVGHGLGVKPAFIIIKNRDWAASSGAWVTWSQAQSSSLGYLNTTGAFDAADYGYFMGSTQPTNSVFTIRSDTIVSAANRYRVNGGSTYKYVAYCFAEVEGFSKFGSYTGNGSTDGPFVYTGFRPKFLMFKTTTIIGHWVIVDTERSTYNVIDDSLYPDTSGSEINTITDVDFLSNGFKWRGVLANETNVNGQVYIYMAFAENPFKVSLAR